MSKRLFLFALLISLSGLIQATDLKPYTGKGPTPPLALQDIQGQKHTLEDYKGQVVLVQFWATYCTPCRKEMPSMNNLMKKMGDTPFKILAINMAENEQEVSTFVNEVKPDFTILMDTKGDAIGSWKVFAAPSNFIVDPQGQIRYTLFGGVEWDSDELVAQLKALAAKP